MGKLRFYFGMKMGNQAFYPMVTPRIQAVKIMQYPRRSFSLSRFQEIRAIMEAAT